MFDAIIKVDTEWIKQYDEGGLEGLARADKEIKDVLPEEIDRAEESYKREILKLGIKNERLKKRYRSDEMCIRDSPRTAVEIVEAQGNAEGLARHGLDVLAGKPQAAVVGRLGYIIERRSWLHRLFRDCLHRSLRRSRRPVSYTHLPFTPPCCPAAFE